MYWLRLVVAVSVVVIAVGCSGAPPPPGDDRMTAATRHAADRESTFGPIEVGADYPSYRRVTETPFLSLVHGNRWVHVWVNEIGAAAYLDGSAMPTGSIIVKSSWEDDHGKPSAIEGPLYIMERRPAGYAPEHEDWYFALHWSEPTPDQAKALGGPIYWRGSSPRVAYCSDCHDGYDRGLGGLTPSSLLPR